MEEKIKEYLISNMVKTTLGHCLPDVRINGLLDLFESYAKEMCWKAWKEAALVTDRTKDIEESLYTSWQNENFPNP